MGCDMTSQPTPPILPTDLAATNLTDEERAADGNIADDGTPVGEADRDADIIRSGGDPDDVDSE